MGSPFRPTPSTHILKPPTGEFDGHTENEHFCLRLALSLTYQLRVQNESSASQKGAFSMVQDRPFGGERPQPKLMPYSARTVLPSYHYRAFRMAATFSLFP